jgi:quinol monooxygenase YgiN
MIYEIAYIEIKPGHESLFETAVQTAVPHFQHAQGCRSLKLERGIENANSYRLVIGWDSVEDHMETFRQSEGFQIWRELASPHFAKPPQVEHVSTVLTAF